MHVIKLKGFYTLDQHFEHKCFSIKKKKNKEKHTPKIAEGKYFIPKILNAYYF